MISVVGIGLKVPKRSVLPRSVEAWAKAALFVALLSGSSVSSQAQITVGDNGINTTNSTAYSGTQSLTKTGANTVTLTGASTYTGGTIVNQGTLVLADGFSGNSGSTGVGPFTIGNGATLRVTASQLWFNGNPTFNFTSSGGGTIDTSTSASVNFIMANNGVYTSAGGAQNQIIGSSSINMNFKALTFSVAQGTDANADLVVSVPLVNSASGITKTGNGTLILSANNTYTVAPRFPTVCWRSATAGRTVLSAPVTSQTPGPSFGTKAIMRPTLS